MKRRLESWKKRVQEPTLFAARDLVIFPPVEEHMLAQFAGSVTAKAEGVGRASVMPADGPAIEERARIPTPGRFGPRAAGSRDVKS